MFYLIFQNRNLQIHADAASFSNWIHPGVVGLREALRARRPLKTGSESLRIQVWPTAWPRASPYTYMYVYIYIYIYIPESPESWEYKRGRCERAPYVSRSDSNVAMSLTPTCAFATALRSNIYIYIYIHISIHIHIYIYIYIYTHIYILCNLPPLIINPPNKNKTLGVFVYYQFRRRHDYPPHK